MKPGRRRWVKLIVALVLSLIVLSVGADSSAPSNSPAFSFAAPTDYSLSGALHDFAIGDVNGDGLPDIVVTAGRRAPVSILFGKGGGKFDEPREVPIIGGRPVSIALGDFNEDGKLDLVAGCPSPSRYVSLYLGKGDGDFLTVGDYRTDSDVWRVVTGDFDGDGRLDVAAQSDGGQVLLYPGDGKGKLGTPRSYPIGARVATAPKLPVSAGPQYRTASAPLKKGDPLSLLILNCRSEALSVLVGTGKSEPAFREPILAPLDNICQQWIDAAFGDINGDGFVDIVGPDFTDDKQKVFFGDGRGAYRFGGEIDGAGPSAVADFDGDGKADIAVFTHESVYVHRNREGGHFDSPAVLGLGGRSPVMKAADLNGDGLPDLAFLDQVYSRLVILLNETQTAHAKAASTGLSLRAAAANSSPVGSTSEAKPAAAPDSGLFDLKQYQIKHWTVEEGLPQSEVHAICQTPDGYIWAGTLDGLARFDGHHFTLFNHFNTPVMKSDVCWHLTTDSEGAIWAGTTKGILRLKNGAAQWFDEENGALKNGHVEAVWGRRDGSVWISTPGGFHSYSNGKMRSELPSLKGCFAGCFYEDFEGALWTTSDAGIMTIASGSKNAEPTGNRAGIVWGVNSVAEDREGNHWFGDWKGGIARLKDGKIQVYNPERQPGISLGSVLSAATDLEKNVWFGAEFGIFRIRDGVLQACNTQRMPRDGFDTIHALCFDRQGALWIGAKQGLFRLKAPPIALLTTRDGLPGNDIWGISEAPDGAVWIGTTTGLGRYTNGQITPFHAGSRAEADAVHTILAARNGDVWIGGDHGGITVLEGGHFKSIIPNWPDTGWVTGITEDSQGQIWVTKNGVSAYQHDKIDDLRSNAGVSWSHPANLFIDSQHRYWGGTHGKGLYCLENGNLSHYTTNEGLASMESSIVREDPNGALWAVSDDGITRYKNGRFRSITAREGLPEDDIPCLFLDRFGNSWFYGKRGIYTVSQKELDDAADGRIARIHVTTYGTADGFPSVGGNCGVWPNACRTQDGRIWFPTAGGVAIVDPAACKRVEPPPVVIEQVIADGSVIAGDRLLAKKPDFVHSTSGGPISLAPGHGQSLIIRFTANCFDAPQLVQFRYKLEGWDQDWVAAADQRQAIYTTLRPGSYRFRIAAADSHGVWNGRGAEFAFGVEPKFTQTGWFTAALAAAGAALVGLFIGWRLKWERMKLRAEKAAAMTEERTRIADDLHDELGGSFTELSVLGSLTAARVDTPDDIRRRGRRITEAAGELADAVDEIVWSLDSRRNSIVDLATYAREFGERMLEPAGIACRWDVPADLPPAPLRAEVRHQLMRLTKEALNNAVKHSRASEVVFQLRWGADSFRWIIADNGAGFDITARSDAGNGLASMRRRVETVGGRLVIMSDRGCGTRIEAEIPMTARRDG